MKARGWLLVSVAGVAAAALAALADTRPGIAPHAAEALGVLGPDAPPEAVPALRDALKRSSADRIVLARTLGRMGPAAADAIPDLVNLLDDRDARFEAALALGAIRPPDPPVPALVNALRDSSLPVRLAAADTLLRLDPAPGATVAPVLGALASSPYPGISLEAAAALRRIDPGKAKQALPALRGTARGEDGEQRLRAAVLLLEIDPDEVRTALPPLQDALRDPNVATRLQVLRLLAQAGPAARPCAPWVSRTLSDPYAEVRREATETLKKIAPGKDGR
jgi:hypothetical protein